MNTVSLIGWATAILIGLALLTFVSNRHENAEDNLDEIIFETSEIVKTFQSTTNEHDLAKRFANLNWKEAGYEIGNFNARPNSYGTQVATYVLTLQSDTSYAIIGCNSSYTNRVITYVGNTSFSQVIDSPAFCAGEK